MRDLADGGTWNLSAGQPTDDSEMALLLARSLVENQIYDQVDVLKQYQYWLSTDLFDCGTTIAGSLRGNINFASQANGALMRISPLGIFGVNYSNEQIYQWAVNDADLTHFHIICKEINALYAIGISLVIKENLTPLELYQEIKNLAIKFKVKDEIKEIINKAKYTNAKDFITKQGWVLIAFQNALYQLLHSKNFEEGVVSTVMQGGDTDTNAAICGALLGAVYGINNIPQRWVDVILNCRPDKYSLKPRSEVFWPCDALELAEKLIHKSDKTKTMTQNDIADYQKLVDYLPTIDEISQDSVRAVTDGCYYIYKKKVNEFFTLLGNVCENRNIVINYQFYNPNELLEDDEKIANANLLEIRAMLTFFTRGERFFDGFRNARLKNAQVKKVLQRLKKLINSELEN